MVKILTSLVLSLLMFAPAPIIQPGEPFIFDPNQCPSPPMRALVIPPGFTYVGELDVYDGDGDPVTISANKITVALQPKTSVKDPNDVLGLAVLHTFDWSWTPTLVDVGIHYIDIGISDPHEPGQSRTIVLLIKINQPPVIISCR